MRKDGYYWVRLEHYSEWMICWWDSECEEFITSTGCGDYVVKIDERRIERGE